MRSLFNTIKSDDENTDRTTTKFELPEDYFLYIRSNSLLSKNYKLETAINWTTTVKDSEGKDVIVENISKLVVAPNKMIREDDTDKILSSYYNKAIILTPYVVLNSTIVDIINKNGEKDGEKIELYANVIHDSYTQVEKVDLVYYRKPKRFDVIGVNNTSVLDHCELPENVHMEIVEGAVEMFITEAKYRLNMKQPNER